MLEKFVTTVEKAGKYFSDMWKYLKVAIEMDKSDAKARAANPNLKMPPASVNANVKNWVKIFGVAAACIVALLIWLIYRLQPHKSRSFAPRRSHHGYNREGTRY